MIEANQLRKVFGNTVAVDSVSFTAPDGYITGLLGPNGAGKTTMLRMIYGLMSPDKGTVRIDGIDTFADPIQARKRIGVLSDSHGLYQRLTARENIAYYAQLHGMSEQQQNARIAHLIQLLDLIDIIDRRVEGFSQGEKMKTAIARILVHDPHTIILDEPTNGLDIMTTRSMRRAIKSLAGQGKCIVFSTHIMQEVSALCDHVIIIAKGVVKGEGSPGLLLKQTGKTNLEDAFIHIIGGEQGLAA
ncbi:MAG: ATP-binding cassette domain-containing protein [Burkholderiales bacterium]